MVSAYVLVTASAGTSRPLLADIHDVAGVGEAHIVAGEYDIVAEIDAEAVGDLMDAVASKIRALEGVVDTRTYVCLE